MTLIIPEGFAQVSFIFGDIAFPTGALSTIGVANGTDLSATAVATAAEDAFSTNWMPQFTNDVVLETVRAKLGPNETGAMAEVPSGTVGSVNDNNQAPNVAILVQKVTALGGRKGRGRMFLPSVDKDLISPGGSVDVTEIGNLQTAANAFKTAMEAADLPLYLLHSDATAPTAITSLSISPKVATQRRRLRR